MSVALTTSATQDATLDAMLAAYNDVTERLKSSHDRLAEEVGRLRDQLDQKNRELARRERLAALGEMAAGVAHEIRNPLSGINLYASVLCRDLADRPSCQELAEKIAAGVRTLDGIVGDILVFAGQTVTESRPVSIAEVIRAAVELAESERLAIGATIDVDPAIDGVVVSADYNQLQRAILNMTLNAIGAVSENGSVWIGVSPGTVPAEISIDISDDGPGIEPSIRDRIFNPFFTTRDSGTGLGLAIVHRIAEAHGGRVTVDERPGGGARFHLVLCRVGDT